MRPERHSANRSQDQLFFRLFWKENVVPDQQQKDWLVMHADIFRILWFVGQGVIKMLIEKKVVEVASYPRWRRYFFGD